jgi:hypothetical protein
MGHSRGSNEVYRHPLSFRDLIDDPLAGHYKLAIFPPLLLGLFRVPAMLEQGEANPEPTLWRLWTCAQTSVEPAAPITHGWAAARGTSAGPGAALSMGSLLSFHSLPPSPRITSPVLVTLPTMAWPPSYT